MSASMSWCAPQSECGLAMSSRVLRGNCNHASSERLILSDLTHEHTASHPGAGQSEFVQPATLHGHTATTERSYFLACELTARQQDGVA